MYFTCKMWFAIVLFYITEWQDKKERMQLVANISWFYLFCTACKKPLFNITNYYMMYCETFSTFLFQLYVLNEDVASSGYTFFKFEPFILHLMCKTMKDAQTIVSIHQLADVYMYIWHWNNYALFLNISNPNIGS